MNQKDNIKNIVGLLASAGLTMATSGGNNIVGLLNTIAGGILGNYVNDLSYNKLKGLVNGIDPKDLNHDIKKIILSAVENCISLICHSYNKKYFLAGHQKSRLDKLEKHLLLEVKALKDKIYNENDSLYRQIEDPNSVHELFELFNLSVDSYHEIHPKHPFGEYFENEFIPILQLCFGEQLKLEKNRPALIAYQRDIYQNLDKKLDKTISQNNKILAKLDAKGNAEELVAYNNSLVTIKHQISDKKDATYLLPEFEQIIDDYYDNISKDISKILSEIESVTTEIKSNWVEKNKTYIMGAGIVMILIIALISYNYYNVPFNSTIILSPNQSIQINSQYPPLAKKQNTKVIFYLEETTLEKTYTKDGISLTDLQKNLLDEKVKIELVDPYWEFTSDFIVLKKGSIIVDVQPNNALSEIRGRVFHHIGHEPISDAKIKMVMEGIETVTDQNGIFYIEVPIELRKSKYDIRVIANGLDSITRTYEPGDEISIGLFKNMK